MSFINTLPEGAEWGSITGTLSNQIDLGDELRDLNTSISTLGQQMSAGYRSLNAAKQNVLTVGSGIDITSDTISADNTIARTSQIPTVPTNVSAFTNDAGYLTSYTETDPVFTASAAHGITASDITAWNGKQDALTAGDNITISGSIISSPTEVLYGVVTGSTDDLSCTITYAQAQDAIDAGHIVILLYGSTRYIYSYKEVSAQMYFPVKAQSQTVAGLTYTSSKLAIFTVSIFYPWSRVSGKPTLVSKDVILDSASWSSDTYTITDSGITATSTVTLTYPVSTSASDYTALQDADIRATAQAAGSLTLQALGTVPTSDLTITLVIQNGW
jgi:hypothetical protein